MKKNLFILEEMQHHDEEAQNYSKRSETDYIWEVPTELFLLKKEYFSPHANVLDFGCGPSTLIKHILPEKILEQIEYKGIDISEKMLKIAKKNIPNGKFIQEDMESAKFKLSSTDIIISLGALHHSQNQLKTIDNWLKLLRPKGRILLREPLYDAFHKGEGESPNEEGVKINELLVYLKTKKVKVVTLVFFTSPFFHLLNKILIKIKLGSWQKYKRLWYPTIYADIYMDKLFGKFYSFFHGLSFAMEIIKE